MNPSNQGKTGTHIPFIFILFLALFSVSVFPDNVNAKALKNATFAYLDVAQGNAELIKIGNQAVLIDTGKHSEYSTLQSQLKRLGVKTISTLVVTHPDADHMESADDVIADYHVKKIILPQIASTTQCYKRMMSAISKHKVKRIHPRTGSTLKLAPSCKGTVLSADASSSDTNEASIVMRVTYGSRSFLYMGDATARVENAILASGKAVASDIYLLSHHGSDTANGVLFVKKALASKYKTAIISVGKNNSYGHPVANVVRRAETYAKALYRTDQKGCIIATTNGENLQIKFKKVTHSGSSYNRSSYRSSGATKSSAAKSSSVKDVSKVVYITKTGTKYHTKNCRYLRSSSIKTTLSKAKSKGLTPCSVCKP